MSFLVSFNFLIWFIFIIGSSGGSILFKLTKSSFSLLISNLLSVSFYYKIELSSSYFYSIIISDVSI